MIGSGIDVIPVKQHLKTFIELLSSLFHICVVQWEIESSFAVGPKDIVAKNVLVLDLHPASFIARNCWYWIAC